MDIRIKELREDKDLTQAQMARMLGVSQATYSRYESGRLDIPTDVLIKIARFHRVSTDYILELQN
ncbi:MAG: helix-turn-helix transcriptional regulator [Clostridia bacterium]|nr:helix-turn-helix transcriptional regulator [Clostridia bacterium]